MAAPVPSVSPVVDVHTHVVPKGWPDLAVACGGSGWPWLRIDSERAAMIMVGDTAFRPVGAECWDADTRLADMTADGSTCRWSRPPRSSSATTGRPTRR